MDPVVGNRDHRADYGYDAPLTGLLPNAAGGLALAALSAYHYRRGRRVLATAELLSSVLLLVTAAIYVHATRRGKFHDSRLQLVSKREPLGARTRTLRHPHNVGVRVAN